MLTCVKVLLCLWILGLTHTARMTKTGAGKFVVMMFRNKETGICEEWTMSFSDAGLVMVQLILTRSNFVDEEGG